MVLTGKNQESKHYTTNQLASGFSENCSKTQLSNLHLVTQILFHSSTVLHHKQNAHMTINLLPYDLFQCNSTCSLTCFKGGGIYLSPNQAWTAQ